MIHSGWEREGEQLRYFPAPTEDDGHFIIGITQMTGPGRRHLMRIYRVAESGDVAMKMLVPESIKSVEEMQAWALSIWRMA